ncbi:cupin domain-containing protein [Robbsia sp. KACC 23696]|uniref:cupin domain-containing protein n=1 Tax=Robbsia sp. KACC 23696 TaxID=3149231 RepID=UPI00325B0C99
MDTHTQSLAADGNASSHCTTLPAATLWRDAEVRHAQVDKAGKHLSTQVDVMTEGQDYAVPAGRDGETVFAVLEGAFAIDAAGESYQLGVGEAILIPPGEPRRIVCLTPRGALYRVGTSLALAVEMGVVPAALSVDGEGPTR